MDDAMSKAREIVTAWWGEDEDSYPEGSPHAIVVSVAQALRAAHKAGQVEALEKIAALEHEPATALIDAIAIARAALEGLGNG